MKNHGSNSSQIKKAEIQLLYRIDPAILSDTSVDSFPQPVLFWLVPL